MGNSVLDHIHRKELYRQIDTFDNVSANYLPYSDFSTAVRLESPVGTRYRLSLTSAVEYLISAQDQARISVDEHPAHLHAKEQLIRHVYGEQHDIARKLRSALYGGASRSEILSLVDALMESMRYDRPRN